MFTGDYFNRTNETRIDATNKAKSFFKYINLKHLAKLAGYSPSMFQQRISSYLIDVGEGDNRRRISSYFTYTTLFKFRLAVDKIVKELLVIHKELTDIVDEMDKEDPTYYDNYLANEQRREDELKEKLKKLKKTRKVKESVMVEQ